jgi:hypothetical protein
LAGRFPRHREHLQTFDGILLIGGFALLGYSLDAALGDLGPRSALNAIHIVR